MNAVDTNVFLYACDRSDLRKNAIAKRLVRQTEGGVLLWQVAVEFVAASRRLEYRGFTPTMAWARLRGFARSFRLIIPTPAILSVAEDVHLQHQWSFWDAMIVAACVEAGVTCLYSEDMPGHLPPLPLKIINPFA